MAQAMGIPVPWVLTGVFALGAGDGGGERRAVRAAGGVDYNMGLDWVLKAFIVVVVGGMGSLGGSSSPPFSSACWNPMPRSGWTRRRRSSCLSSC